MVMFHQRLLTFEQMTAMGEVQSTAKHYFNCALTCITVKILDAPSQLVFVLMDCEIARRPTGQRSQTEID